ncbi:hypothetical protein [Nitrospira sp. ND1]|uniref:hypothetical protein n=1 Tax=Nitrospira sp. ND1 TaxID=1658518 RepID=UPI0009BA5C70|nr:hypothetical protein [Nitrospira sp. ND1]
MNYRDNIIADLARSECETLSRKVIRSLTKMTDGMQSGDDTPLKNIWDEICVQVQGQESVMWDAYLDTIESLILGELVGLDSATKQAIWLQTDDGTDWSVENEDQDGQDVPIVCEDIAKYILDGFVLLAATNWTNKRIEKYLERELE